MLVPYSEDDDLVSLLLVHNPRFRLMVEAAEKRLDETGGIPHDEFWKRVDALYSSSSPPARRVAQRRTPYHTKRARKKK